jgi:hypothetical protein
VLPIGRNGNGPKERWFHVQVSRTQKARASEEGGGVAGPPLAPRLRAGSRDAQQRNELPLVRRHIAVMFALMIAVARVIAAGAAIMTG